MNDRSKFNEENLKGVLRTYFSVAMGEDYCVDEEAIEGVVDLIINEGSTEHRLEAEEFGLFKFLVIRDPWVLERNREKHPGVEYLVDIHSNFPRENPKYTKGLELRDKVHDAWEREGYPGRR